MRKHKVHYELVISHANESDPMTWSELACGIEDCERATMSKREVTCRRCLKYIAAQERQAALKQVEVLLVQRGSPQELR